MFTYRIASLKLGVCVCAGRHTWSGLRRGYPALTPGTPRGCSPNPFGTSGAWRILWVDPWTARSPHTHTHARACAHTHTPMSAPVRFHVPTLPCRAHCPRTYPSSDYRIDLQGSVGNWSAPVHTVHLALSPLVCPPALPYPTLPATCTRGMAG